MTNPNIRIRQTSAERYRNIVHGFSPELLGGAVIFKAHNGSYKSNTEFEDFVRTTQEWLSANCEGRVETHLVGLLLFYISFYYTSDAMNFKLTFC